MTTCKHYKLRWFYSKGAFLILLWILLGSTASVSVIESVVLYFNSFSYPKWPFILPLFTGVLGAVVSGWLADAKLGNYRVCKYGLWILFASTLLLSMSSIIHDDYFQNHSLLFSILICVVGSLFAIGVASFLVTSFQLGLDQMPDASSTNITSFIAWFLFTLSCSIWAAHTIIKSTNKCLSGLPFFIPALQLYSLIPPTCIAIILVLDYTLAPKWLIIEPESPQSLRTIYRVLKFAAKHKAPLNRSALTYWEENVPSRMDLGKLRYGGPFTTEQVENVKTILRLFPFGLSLILSGFSFTLGYPAHLTEVYHANGINLTLCNSKLLKHFTYNSAMCSIVWILIHEFVIYPLLWNKLARISISKRIGIIVCSATLLNVGFLIIELVHFYAAPQLNILPLVLIILIRVSNGVLGVSLISSMLEFVCAQAPYNMRGFFSGYSVFLTAFSLGLGKLINYYKVHETVMIGLKTGVSVFGFILYCIQAHWYKLRVRDEDYHPQPVVEEIYDRYLSEK